jgi:hypothetical protein
MASIGQFVGATLPDLVNRVLVGDIRSAVNQGISFLICTAGFVLVGGVVAYFFQSRTQNRWALFLIGAVFTSVGVQALPGAKKLLKMADIPIGSAYAQTQSLPYSCKLPPVTIVGGIKQFLRLDDNNTASDAGGYRVVVGSFKDLSAAQALATKINSNDPSLHPSVSDRYQGNDYYAVVVGPPSTTLDEAKKIQSKVLSLDYIPGAFISKPTC